MFRRPWQKNGELHPDRTQNLPSARSDGDCQVAQGGFTIFCMG